MFIQFRVKNFRSFRDEAVFTMEATSLKADESSVDENNTFSASDGTRLLKSAAIYGANASGKSNLITAMRFMRQFVIGSSRDTQALETIPVEPFRLNAKTSEDTSLFEMIFLIEGIQYRYGFEVTRKNIVSEWLHHVPKSREALLFKRTDQKIQVKNIFKEGDGLEDKTRHNALFLSVVAQFNGSIAGKILKWFSHLQILPIGSEVHGSFLTMACMENSSLKKRIVDLLCAMDSGMDNIQIRTEEEPELPPGLPNELKQFLTLPSMKFLQKSVETSHAVFNDESEEVGSVLFDMDRQESTGTQKLFFLAGPLLSSLNGGYPLVVDELDARLHPVLTRTIISMFSTPETNPKNAQLIFATHDTNLLDKALFRRDQIWFTEKDSFGATSLYSLAEFKVRNDASYGRDYIRGKYGAIPFIGDFSFLLESSDE